MNASSFKQNLPADQPDTLIYLDHCATTRPCPAAIDAMQKALCTNWGNPSSLHCMGTAAQHLLQQARMTLLQTLGYENQKPENLIFTAGGTEADHLALFGTTYAKAQHLHGGKIIISDSEHAAVEQAAQALETMGIEVVRIPTRGGVFDMDAYQKALTPHVFLVSCMLVNNETGAVNDIAAIAAAARRVRSDVTIHTDAVQGYQKFPFRLSKLGADLITLSAHKIHGPKGVGALYVSPAVCKSKRLRCVITGGGQEHDMRSGTENMPGIAGFAAAAAWGDKQLREHLKKLHMLRDHLLQRLQTDPALSEIQCNSPQSALCAPHILSITLPHIKSNTALNFLSARGICVSGGSACSSNHPQISRTLLHFGLDRNAADSTLRISFSPENTIDQLDRFADALREAVTTLIRFS